MTNTAVTVIASGNQPLDALLYTFGLWDGAFYIEEPDPAEEKPA